MVGAALVPYRAEEQRGSAEVTQFEEKKAGRAQTLHAETRGLTVGEELSRKPSGPRLVSSSVMASNALVI